LHLDSPQYGKEKKKSTGNDEFEKVLVRGESVGARKGSGGRGRGYSGDRGDYRHGGYPGRKRRDDDDTTKLGRKNRTSSCGKSPRTTRGREHYHRNKTGIILPPKFPPQTNLN